MIDAAKHLAKRLGAVGAYRSLRAKLVSRMAPLRVWREGLPAEIEFWEQVLPERVAADPAYKVRADPQAPIRDPLVKMLIGKIPEEVISIIDVGAGPLTALGKTYPGKTLRITATDPLATEYARIMQRSGIEPPIPPIPCRGEDLLDLFRPGTFDIAFARNALDHCVDPIRVITNMLELVKKERFVVLRHLRREGDRNLYRGLHQWNFDIADGELIIWRGASDKIRASRVLAPGATIDCFEEGHWIVCLLTATTERATPRVGPTALG